MDGQILQVPYSAEAEQSVVGAMILDRDASDKAVEVLSHEDFYIRQNAVIFSALYDMTTAGETIDPVTLIERLKKRGEYDEAGGSEYIVGVMEFVPTTANIA
jgi:replicative DNA helicase